MVFGQRAGDAKRKEREQLNAEIEGIFARLDKSFDITFKRSDQIFEKASERFRAAEERMRDSEKRLRDKLQRVTKQNGDSVTQVSISSESPLQKMATIACLIMIFIAVVTIFTMMISSEVDTTPLDPPAIEQTIEGDNKL